LNFSINPNFWKFQHFSEQSNSDDPQRSL